MPYHGPPNGVRRVDGLNRRSSSLIEEELLAVTLNINGKDVSVNADGTDTLQLALRDDLGMTGTKFGCGLGQCGACSVIIDGKAVRSCQTTVQDTVGKKVMTIEGLAVNGKLHAVQQAWIDMQVPQCGYCLVRPNHGGRSLPAGHAQADGGSSAHRHGRPPVPLWHL